MGEAADPVEIRLVAYRGPRPSTGRRFKQGIVISYHEEPGTGDAIYRVYISAIPPRDEQVALARKICAVEGAVSVDGHSGMRFSVEVLRRALSAEEFTLFRFLVESQQAGGTLTSLVNLARLEGQEGHENIAALLDRPEEEWETTSSGLGAFSLRDDVSGEELYRLLVQREFPGLRQPPAT